MFISAEGKKLDTLRADALLNESIDNMLMYLLSYPVEREGKRHA
jgi:hypothetical protein